MNPNDYAKQCERALKRKLELVEYKGGKCEKCTYDENMAALEFHHLNPSEKSFQLDSRHLSNTSIKKLKEEADKCVLVCANCHREIHHPEFTKENIQKMLEQFSVKTVKIMDTSTKKMSICPNCNREFPSVSGKIFCSDECRKEVKKMRQMKYREQRKAKERSKNVR